jgi:hypothetical protein
MKINVDFRSRTDSSALSASGWSARSLAFSNISGSLPVHRFYPRGLPLDRHDIRAARSTRARTVGLDRIAARSGSAVPDLPGPTFPDQPHGFRPQETR